MKLEVTISIAKTIEYILVYVFIYYFIVARIIFNIKTIFFIFRMTFNKDLQFKHAYKTVNEHEFLIISVKS